jgi:GNAT superfamily N-acetyltransferase
MNIQFTSPGEHPEGTAFNLLKQAWAPLWNPRLEENIRQFDSDVTKHPHTVGACTFVTCLESEPVGVGSYDPRPKPARGLIGWNCVIPKCQRQGIGKTQILEILRIFRSLGIQKACVTTTDEDFCVPAQRTYEACGFVKVRKTEDSNIEYELELKDCTTKPSTTTE